MATEQSNAVPDWRSFVEKSKKKAASRNLTFVHVEIVDGAQKTKKSQSLKRQKSNSEEPEPSELQSPASQAATSRRKQVYDAQQRHRTRKAEYAQSLQEQIDGMKREHRLVKVEGHRLASENAMISQLLLSKGLLSEADCLDLVAEHDVFAASPSLIGDNVFDESPPLIREESMASSAEESEAPESSSREKSYLLLDESEFPDPQTDSPSRAKINECRDLLLQEIRPFGLEEGEDKKTWEVLADLILDER